MRPALFILLSLTPFILAFDEACAQLQCPQEYTICMWDVFYVPLMNKLAKMNEEKQNHAFNNMCSYMEIRNQQNYIIVGYNLIKFLQQHFLYKNVISSNASRILKQNFFQKHILNKLNVGLDSLKDILSVNVK